MGQNCAHQKKRLDKRTRIPAVFAGTTIIAAGHIVEFDSDFIDETAAAAEQRQPEVLESWRLNEQLRLFDARRDSDTLLVAFAVGKGY